LQQAPIISLFFCQCGTAPDAILHTAAVRLKIKKQFWKEWYTMVKIRLRRVGAKKAPFYRVVVADSRYPRDGRFIEEIGYYNPLENPAVIRIDLEKAKQWMANGAQPTDTVRDLLKKAEG